MACTQRERDIARALELPARRRGRLGDPRAAREVAGGGVVAVLGRRRRRRRWTTSSTTCGGGGAAGSSAGRRPSPVSRKTSVTPTPDRSTATPTIIQGSRPFFFCGGSGGWPYPPGGSRPDLRRRAVAGGCRTGRLADLAVRAGWPYGGCRSAAAPAAGTGRTGSAGRAASGGSARWAGRTDRTDRGLGHDFSDFLERHRRATPARADGNVVRSGAPAYRIQRRRRAPQALPNRRWREAYSSHAAHRCRRSKSGQSVSRKTSSA